MNKRWATWLGLVAMMLLVVGAFLPGGSLTQKILFIVGAPTLGVTAVVNRQPMFSALQGVVTLGAILVFFPALPVEPRYILMLGGAVLAVCWLGDSGYYRHDRSGWVGTVGLTLIAIGLATPAAQYPLLFFVALGFGGLLVALYSGFSIAGGFRLGWIWLILNLLFAANPFLQLVRMF